MARTGKYHRIVPGLIVAAMLACFSFPTVARACLATDLAPAGQQSAGAKYGGLQASTTALKPQPNILSDFGGSQLQGMFQQISQAGNLFNVASGLVGLLTGANGLNSLSGLLNSVMSLAKNGASKFMSSPGEAFPALGGAGGSAGCNNVTNPPVTDFRNGR